MKKIRLLACLLSLLCASRARAQGPVLTTVADTVYASNGQLANGSVTISNPIAFISQDGYPVSSKLNITSTITNGAMSLNLVPNVVSTPGGAYYIASYILPGGTYSEYWVVPNSGVSVKLLQVRAATPPIPSISVPFAQLTPPINCQNEFPEWTAQGWVCGAAAVASNPLPTVGTCAVWTSTSPATLGGVPCGASIFLSYQWGSAAPVTGAGNYAQVTPSSMFALSQTGAGTILSPFLMNIGFSAQAGNCVIASPANGSSAPPTCRQLIGADLAQVSQMTYHPTPVRNGDVEYWNSGTGWTTLPGNTGSSATFIEDGSGNPSWAAASVALTSVGITQTGTIFTITNSPLIANGAINLAFSQEPANTVFANCGVANAVPTFCIITPAMLPTTTVTAGSYSNANITVNAQGQITAAANGSSSVSNITVNGGSSLTGAVNFQNGSAVTGITINASNPSGSNVQFAISGTLTNAGLANPATTVSGVVCTLGSTCTVPYSGLSGLPALPANTPSISNDFLAAYDSTTGIFTQLQADFSNISGTLSNAQLPTSGVTAASYTSANITVNAQGIITSATNGSGGGGGTDITVNGGSALTSPVDFQTGSGSNIVNGLTVTPVNSSGSEIQFYVSGALTNAGLANSSTNVSGSSCTLGGSCTVAYSGLSGLPTLPANTSATTNQWFNSYTSSTGVFGKSQPAFTNISGTLVNAQLPTSAVTPGSYTSANITVNAQGIITLAANGSGGGSNITVNGGSPLGSPVNFATGAAVTGLTINAQNLTGNNITFALSGTLTNAGLANSAITVSTATCTLGGTCTIPYSGLSGTPTLPVNTPAVTHQWLNSYNSSTGAFTQTQPAYSDLTGAPTLYYQTVAANGTAQTQRPTLNLIPGTNITAVCADNSGANRTDCTIGMPTTFGNVSSSGSPASPQLAQWVSASSVQGIATVGGGANPLMATIIGTLTNGQIFCVNGGVPENCTPGIPVTQQTGGFTMSNLTRANLQILNSTGAIAVTMPTLAALPNNYFADFYNVNSGTATFTSSGGVFMNCSGPGSATSAVIPTNGFGILYNDGTNYCLPAWPTFASIPNTGSTSALTFNSATQTFGTISVSTCAPLSGANGGVVFNNSGCPFLDSTNFYYQNSGTAGLAIGNATGAVGGGPGELLLAGSASSNRTTTLLAATGSSGNTNFRFPFNAGTSSGWVLSTDGSGNTSWVAPTGNVASVSGDGTVDCNTTSTGTVTMSLCTNWGPYSTLSNKTSGTTSPTVTNAPIFVSMGLHASSGTNNCSLSINGTLSNALNVCGTNLVLAGGQVAVYNSNTLVNNGIPSETFDTDTLNTKVSIGSTPMTGTLGANTKFTFRGTVSQVNVGVGCSVPGSVGVNVIYTDQLSGVSITQVVPISSGAAIPAETLGFTTTTIGAANIGTFEWTGYVSNGGTVNYSTTVTTGTCTTQASYGIVPIFLVN